MRTAERPDGDRQHASQRRGQAARYLYGVCDCLIFVTDAETRAIARAANREALERELREEGGENDSRRATDSLQ